MAANNESTTSNVVSRLGSVSKRNEILAKQDANRKEEFESLRNKMSAAAPKMGREILMTSELYDSNILKGDQEARKEKI